MEEEFVYIIQEYDYLYDESVIRLVCKTKEIAERNREEMENDLSNDEKEICSLRVYEYLVRTE